MTDHDTTPADEPAWQEPDEPTPTAEIRAKCREAAEREFVDACRQAGVEPNDDLRAKMLDKGECRFDRLTGQFTWLCAGPDGVASVNRSLADPSRYWASTSDVLRGRWLRSGDTSGVLRAAAPPAGPVNPGSPLDPNYPRDAFGKPLQGINLLAHAYSSPRVGEPSYTRPGGTTVNAEGKFVDYRGRELRGVELLAEANRQRGNRS